MCALLSRKTVWEVATAPAAAGTLFSDHQSTYFREKSLTNKEGHWLKAVSFSRWALPLTCLHDAMEMSREVIYPIMHRIQFLKGSELLLTWRKIPDLWTPYEGCVIFVHRSISTFWNLPPAEQVTSSGWTIWMTFEGHALSIKRDSSENMGLHITKVAFFDSCAWTPVSLESAIRAMEYMECRMSSFEIPTWPKIDYKITHRIPMVYGHRSLNVCFSRGISS